MILPKIRDPRFITFRRGGTLSDDTHHLLALWAALCADHVLSLFEKEGPDYGRPRKAILLARTWARGELRLNDAKRGAWESNNAARDLKGAAKYAAYSAAQAAVVGHVAAHDLGAAAYAIRAVMAASEEGEKSRNGAQECAWQRGQLPLEIRDLVMDDEKNRDDICWNVFFLEGGKESTKA